jgi:hypothetical protein
MGLAFLEMHLDVLALLGSIDCLHEENPGNIFLTIPNLLNAFPLLGSGGQISRYILATLLVSPLFSGYLLTISPSQDHLNHIE